MTKLDNMVHAFDKFDRDDLATLERIASNGITTMKLDGPVGDDLKAKAGAVAIYGLALLGLAVVRVARRVEANEAVIRGTGDHAVERG